MGIHVSFRFTEGILLKSSLQLFTLDKVLTAKY
jgi:hypothetical protein